MTGPPGALPPGRPEHELAALVRALLDEHVPEGARVVVAVSGGSDSAALAALTIQARDDLEVLAVHARHGLRDDAADARAAATLAGTLGLGLREVELDVSAGGDGPEAAARRARYAALVSVAHEVGAIAILVGHSADDQAETVLLNIARGAGLAGLAGMTERRDLDGIALLRPLLRARRCDIRRLAADRGLPTVEDPTNTDPSQRRARARHDLLPALGRLQGSGGDAVGPLTRLAHLARLDSDALEELAGRRLDEQVRWWGPCAAFPCAALEDLPEALATRVVRLLLARVTGRSAGPSLATVWRVRTLANGRMVKLPGGGRVSLAGGWLAAAPEQVPSLPARSLRVPGDTPLPELGLVLHVDAQDAAEPTDVARVPGRTTAARALVAVQGDLVVRARRPGDRIRLPAGGRALQDVLVDAAVPRLVRDLVPVVATASGDVLWVPGVAVAHGTAGHVRLWLASATPE